MTMTAHEILKAAVGFELNDILFAHEKLKLWSYAIQVIKENTSLRDALESMVWQFGDHGAKNDAPFISTGGLSTLEEAFRILQWDDPHILQDGAGVSCDVSGCYEDICSLGGNWSDSGYWHCCAKHSEAAREGEPKPGMKSHAIERENSRDKKTGYLPHH